MPQPNYLEPWYRALRSPAGVCFRIIGGSYQLAIAKLYAARREALDPNLSTLSICASPTDPGELWIVHSKEPIDASQANTNGRQEGDDELPSIELFEDGGTLP